MKKTLLSRKRIGDFLTSWRGFRKTYWRDEIPVLPGYPKNQGKMATVEMITVAHPNAISPEVLEMARRMFDARTSGVKT